MNIIPITQNIMNSLLKSNSNEMKTVVETFLEPENAELIYDNESLDEWNQVVLKLGLEGQNAIRKPERSPIPFLAINTSMQNIMDELCPSKVKIGAYSKSTIPLEILQLVALAMNEEYFDDIYIYYNDKAPDPFCVGCVYNVWRIKHKEHKDKDFKSKKAAEDFISEQSNPDDYKTEVVDWWNVNRFLIGKWGAEKLSFEELREIATKKYITRQSEHYDKQLREAQVKLESIRGEAFEKFN